MSIVVENISKNYGAQKALDNISFSIKKGEIVIYKDDFIKILEREYLLCM